MKCLSILVIAITLQFLFALSAQAAELIGTIDLAAMGTQWQGLTMTGSAREDLLGNSVSNAGDFNGDGIDDFLISAFEAEGEGLLRNSGEVYLVYGMAGAAAPSGAITRADIGTTVSGVIFSGELEIDRAGLSVSNAGDINDDGIADILISSRDANRDGLDAVGETYLVYGQNGAAALSGTISLSTVGLTVSGAVFRGAGERHGAGSVVANAGDMNNDGIDDFLISAGAANDGRPPGERSAAYLIYGQSGPSELSGEYTLDAVGTTVSGAVFAGLGFEEAGNTNLAFAGDVNRDGISDFLIGSPSTIVNGNFEAGETYLVFGPSFPSTLSGDYEVSTIGSAIPGVQLEGENTRDQAGISVATAGDFNGDGIDDFLVGAWSADPGGADAGGKAYLIYGKLGFTPFLAPIDLADVGGTVEGVVFNGVNQADRVGRHVSTAGDVNGDGIDDILIGAPGFAFESLNGVPYTDSGHVYLVYGQAGGAALSGSVDVSDVGSSVRGVNFNGVHALDLVSFVSNGGDVNGDGFDDILIGGSRIDANGVRDNGQAFLIYGNTGIPEPGTMGLAAIGLGGLV